MILSYYFGGVPMKKKKTRRAVTISMPQDIAEQYDNLTKRLAKNRSVLFREMFLTYRRQILEKEFREIQTYGAQLARKKGLLTEADVEKLVFEGR
jgi:predicted DNA-binding protein